MSILRIAALRGSKSKSALISNHPGNRQQAESYETTTGVCSDFVSENPATASVRIAVIHPKQHRGRENLREADIYLLTATGACGIWLQLRLPLSKLLGSKRSYRIDGSGAAGWQIACQRRCSYQDHRYGNERDRIERANAEQQRSHQAHERRCRAKANRCTNAGQHQR